ncbi:hypothetical protein [uncultured Cocleimonas sp.]|uniref:BufA2 family periplasmic bufferin-type metallophore n=1 Tax=uncultured Cocleimonas sp. TaxID=1051587 RepID=UPI002620233B|nr:hypothetical protein [uncultured Cocleimonas sp.]
MKTASKVTGFTLASAAAALLLAGCSTGGDSAKSASMSKDKKMADVKCAGINSCKGTSACATATSACKGQNSCKGQGWVKATATDCSAKGGKVLGQA